jgi:hypothetical protein
MAMNVLSLYGRAHKLKKNKWSGFETVTSPKSTWMGDLLISALKSYVALILN